MTLYIHNQNSIVYEQKELFQSIFNKRITIQKNKLIVLKNRPPDLQVRRCTLLCIVS